MVRRAIEKGHVTAVLAAQLGGDVARERIEAAADAVMAKVRELDPCYGKARPGEPIFVLRAQDLTAPSRIRDWAASALTYGCSREKADEALEIAAAMDAWAAEHGGKYPD